MVAGQGEQIVLGGGDIVMDAPGGIHAKPGTDFVVLAHQISLRAKGSIDASSTNNDVRLRGYQNVQILGGNDESGGVLIEGRGKGLTQQYKGKIGEDVRANGVVIKAPNSVAAVMGKDVYLRTGGEDLGEGEIVLDASRGKQRVQIYSREFSVYVTKGAGISFAPVDDNSNVTSTYWFGEKEMIADTRLFLGGRLVGYAGGGGTAGITVAGTVRASQSISSGGTVSDNKGGQMGKVPDQFVSGVESAASSAQQAHAEKRDDRKQVHQSTIVDKWYKGDAAGVEGVISATHFSFRDAPGDQYKAKNYRLPESRWQMFCRLGMASGGKPWAERPVTYQGSQTYPYPGRAAWTRDATFLRLESLKLFDPAGVDKPRPGPYEDAELSGWSDVPPDGNYTLNRS